MTTTLSHQEENSSQAHSNYGKFISMQQPEVAKNVRVYLNGNNHFPGRRFVVNRKKASNFEGFLSQVTLGIKAPFGAVRYVYTPQSGHRLKDLDDIQTGMDLVAGGVERFRKMRYRDIAIKKKPTLKKNTMEIKHHHRMDVPAKWNVEAPKPKIIFVYANVNSYNPAARVLLRPFVLKEKEMFKVLTEIDEKLSLEKPARHLYEVLDQSKLKKVTTPKELVNGSYYVAANLCLKKNKSGAIPTFLQNSPRRNIGATLPPIKKFRQPRPPAKEEDGQTYSKMYAKKKYAKEEETTIMGSSAATGYKPLTTKTYKQPKSQGTAPSQDPESVFHAKPVKVKRSGGGRAPVVLTTNDEGIFKNDVTNINADEVEEDEDTKVDLPIDQVPADVVEDEEIATTSSKDNLMDKNAAKDQIVEDNGTDVFSSQHVEEVTQEEKPVPEELEDPPVPAPSSGFAMEDNEEIPEEIKFKEEEENSEEDKNKNYELKKESPLPLSSDPEITEDETKVFEAALQSAALETSQVRSYTPLDEDKDQYKNERELVEDNSETIKDDNSKNISLEKEQQNPTEVNRETGAVVEVENTMESGWIVNNDETKHSENSDALDNKNQNAKSENGEDIPDEEISTDELVDRKSLDGAELDIVDEPLQDVMNDATDSNVNESTMNSQQENNESEHISRTPSSPRPPTDHIKSLESVNLDDENADGNTEHQGNSENQVENDKEVKQQQVEDESKLSMESTGNSDADKQLNTEGDVEDVDIDEKKEDGSQLSSESTARPASEALTIDDNQQNESIENKTDKPPNDIKGTVQDAIVSDL